MDFELSPEIVKLTGWTNAKLAKQGLPKDEIVRRLIKYGCLNRLLISDTSDEFDFIEDQLDIKLSKHRLNVSVLFMLQYKENINLGLKYMLSKVGLKFIGREHKAGDDSQNIARLFQELIDENR